MEQVPALTVLETIERALAQHQAFGSSTYILGRLDACLKERLSNISTRMPIAAELLAVWEKASSNHIIRATEDTVVRCAIVHAHTRLETGTSHGLPLAKCEEVFAATIVRLQRGMFGTTLDDGSLPRLGPNDHHGWIWSENHSADVFGQAYRYLLEHWYLAVPVAPNASEIDLLRKGALLLDQLVPSLAESALRHAQITACVPSAGAWKRVASSSQFQLGATIFLGRSLHNPWWVAEHLLHEALHQKFYDFRHGHLLFEADLRTERDAKVWSPWNSPRLNDNNSWDVHRVFAAFHVYVHLALLAQVAQQRAPELEGSYGPLRDMTTSRTALDRAQYLGEKLRGECWEQLGIAGQRLVDYLTTVLGFLDPSPPPRTSFIHLSLSLYEKEATQVADALRSAQSAGSIMPAKLLPLAIDEIASTRHVLRASGAQQALRRFDDTVASVTHGQLGARFPDVRHAIVDALSEAAPDRYRISDNEDDNDCVAQMIEGGSARLYGILAGYPSAVVEAKRRAAQCQFYQSCEDEVGQLLSVLSGGVQPNGRILEIGTGAGVGTAWITAGLGSRTDVQVISIEIDPSLSDATRRAAWPAWVRILTADASDVLKTLGTFNLVFADAAPVKYGRLAPVLEAVAEGGLLVIDDLEKEKDASESKQAEKDALRCSIFGNPGFQAIEINWASRVILASRSRHAAGENETEPATQIMEPEEQVIALVDVPATA